MHLLIVPDVIQQRDIYSLLATDTIRQAADKMVDHDVAAIVVLGDKGKLEGIVTERDLTRRVVAKGLDPEKTTVDDIMTKDPDTLAPQDSALDALELMRVRKYRHLPVVENDQVVGMVSIRDLYAAVKQALESDIKETEAFVFGDRYGA